MRSADGQSKARPTGTVRVVPGRYHFLTEMSLSAPPAEVERVLRDVTAWPTWWRWARRVERVNHVPSGTVGARYRNQIRTPMLYGFTYETEIIGVADGRIRLDATGDLEGMGVFEYESLEAGGAYLRFSWLVQTSRRWMNLVGPLARPVFTWNHDLLMTDFARGLARTSGGEVTSIAHLSLSRRRPGFFVSPDEHLPGATVVEDQAERNRSAKGSMRARPPDGQPHTR